MSGLGIGLQMLGTRKLLNALEGQKTIKDPLAAAIRKITLFLDRTTKMATPVDTGRLRSSITSQITAEFGQVGTNVEYASFVEFGRGMSVGLGSRGGALINPFTIGQRSGTGHHIENGHRVWDGLGMFGYAMKQLQAKMGGYLKELGDNISVRWGQ